MVMGYFIQDTPQKTNKEAENGPLEKEQHTNHEFLGSMLVFGGVNVRKGILS